MGITRKTNSIKGRRVANTNAYISIGDGVLSTGDYNVTDFSSFEQTLKNTIDDIKDNGTIALLEGNYTLGNTLAPTAVANQATIVSASPSSTIEELELTPVDPVTGYRFLGKYNVIGGVNKFEVFMVDSNFNVVNMSSSPTYTMTPIVSVQSTADFTMYRPRLLMFRQNGATAHANDKLYIVAQGLMLTATSNYGIGDGCILTAAYGIETITVGPATVVRALAPLLGRVANGVVNEKYFYSQNYSGAGAGTSGSEIYSAGTHRCYVNNVWLTRTYSATTTLQAARIVVQSELKKGSSATYYQTALLLNENADVTVTGTYTIPDTPRALNSDVLSGKYIQINFADALIGLGIGDMDDTFSQVVGGVSEKLTYFAVPQGGNAYDSADNLAAEPTWALAGQQTGRSKVTLTGFRYDGGADTLISNITVSDTAAADLRPRVISSAAATATAVQPADAITSHVVARYCKAPTASTDTAGYIVLFYTQNTTNSPTIDNPKPQRVGCKTVKEIRGGSGPLHVSYLAETGSWSSYQGNVIATGATLTGRAGEYATGPQAYPRYPYLMEKSTSTAAIPKFEYYYFNGTADGNSPTGVIDAFKKVEVTLDATSTWGTDQPLNRTPTLAISTLNYFTLTDYHPQRMTYTMTGLNDIAPVQICANNYSGYAAFSSTKSIAITTPLSGVHSRSYRLVVTKPLSIIGDGIATINTTTPICFDENFSINNVIINSLNTAIDTGQSVDIDGSSIKNCTYEGYQFLEKRDNVVATDRNVINSILGE